MTLGEKMKALRMQQGLTLEDVGERVGVGKSTVRKWESGQIANMRRDKIVMVAKALGTTPSYLMGWEEGSASASHSANTKNQPRVQRVPLLGKVAAGEPIYAPEDFDAYVNSPVKCDVALEVQGDSMVPNYLDGDMIYIRCRPDVENGQVAVVFLDDEAVIKHVYHEPDGLLLLSDNPAYAPIHASLEDYPNLRIFGVPVGFTRMYQANPLNKIHKGFKR